MIILFILTVPELVLSVLDATISDELGCNSSSLVESSSQVRFINIVWSTHVIFAHRNGEDSACRFFPGIIFQGGLWASNYIRGWLL